jgi:DNA repair exonuclease SbcCD ATPase subunit
MLPIHSGHSDVEEPTDLRSGSPKNAGKTNRGTRLLSPPGHTVSPEVCRYQKLPSAAEYKMTPPTEIYAYRPSKQHVQTKPMGQNEQRQSSPSICGDLELPSYRSRSKARNHRHKDSLVRPIRCTSTKDSKRLPRYRSSSVASSNISKKRIPTSNRPANKLQVMTHMTEYFNQCLEINEYEVMKAELEVQRLRDDMQNQEMELEKSRALLDEKDAKLNETEELYKALLEKDTRVLGDNESLNSELESLRQQLSKEKKRSELLKEKHQESRSRLNDAIKEQQNLFSRSRDLCQETMDQLRRDKALEASQKKRAEMKKCHEEYRLQADKYIQQSKSSCSEGLKDY